MEAFALKQIEKKKKEREEEEKSLVKYVENAAKLSPEDQEVLNISLGLPPKPPAVHSLGKNASAAIWWDYPHHCV